MCLYKCDVQQFEPLLGTHHQNTSHYYIHVTFTVHIATHSTHLVRVCIHIMYNKFLYKIDYAATQHILYTPWNPYVVQAAFVRVYDSKII